MITSVARYVLTLAAVVMLQIGCSSSSSSEIAAETYDTASIASVTRGGYVRFMEGNNGTQNHKGQCSDAAGQRINFKSTSGFTNDDARSCILFNVRAGAVIRVYDHPNGDTGDDWAEIVVKRQVQRYVIPTFETNINDETVRFTYHPNNGLDGKVSRCEVD